MASRTASSAALRGAKVATMRPNDSQNDVASSTVPGSASLSTKAFSSGETIRPPTATCSMGLVPPVLERRVVWGATPGLSRPILIFSCVFIHPFGKSMAVGDRRWMVELVQGLFGHPHGAVGVRNARVGGDLQQH